MNKYIIVFCEGDHDIAFISRALSVKGFTPYKEKVKDFPKPLSQLYKNNLSKKKIEDFEFKFQRPRQKVPYAVLAKGDTLVIFHNFDGDGSIISGGAESVIKMYLDLNKENKRKIEKYNKLNYRFLYFIDSDDSGVEQRLNALKNNLNIDDLNHHQLVKKDDYEVGCYIFHDHKSGNKEGKLEDLILELMNRGNEGIFSNGSEYIEQNSLISDRCKKYVYDELPDKYVGTIQFKKMKSVISVAGQLQFSGSSNAVIIANSDYITQTCIKENIQCQNIFNLFSV